MTLPNNRCRRIVVLRRRGRTFADVPGARRAVIGRELRARGIATGHVRTGFRGSSGVSGGALTDHPSGTLGSKPQVNDPRGATDGLGRSRARGLFRAILMPRRDRASSPLPSGRTPLCIGTWPCRHAAAEVTKRTAIWRIRQRARSRRSYGVGSAAADIWHLCRHHGHELDICFERQASHRRPRHEDHRR